MRTQQFPYKKVELLEQNVSKLNQKLNWISVKKCLKKHLPGYVVTIQLLIIETFRVINVCSSSTARILLHNSIRIAQQESVNWTDKNTQNSEQSVALVTFYTWLHLLQL